MNRWASGQPTAGTGAQVGGLESACSVARVAGLAALIFLLGAPDSLAQVVQGRVLDGSTAAPLAEVTVTLFRAQGDTVGSSVTDSNGTFHLVLPGGGTAQLSVRRIGFPTHVSEPIEIRPGESVVVEVALTPEAIRLDPLDIVVRGRERGRHAFERRRKEAEGGVFLDAIQIALMEVSQTTQILERVPEVRVDHRGLVHAQRGRCLVVFVDHFPIPVMATGITLEWLAFGGVQRLDEVVGARAIRGIEVYPRINDVPDEVREGFRAREVYDCAVVLVWTTTGW